MRGSLSKYRVFLYGITHQHVRLCVELSISPVSSMENGGTLTTIYVDAPLSSKRTTYVLSVPFKTATLVSKWSPATTGNN